MQGATSVRIGAVGVEAHLAEAARRSHCGATDHNIRACPVKHREGLIIIVGIVILSLTVITIIINIDGDDGAPAPPTFANASSAPIELELLQIHRAFAHPPILPLMRTMPSFPTPPFSKLSLSSMRVLWDLKSFVRRDAGLTLDLRPRLSRSRGA